jgi:preprotein translocase subunit SecB
MTDVPPAGDPSILQFENGPAMQGLRILAQYIRDLSFENPRAPESLRAAGTQPQIELGVEMNARARVDGLYEVDLKLIASAQSSGEPVFQIELLYGGLFQITGIPESEMEVMLMVECPRYLFPYARRVISDLTAEGGFPPFMLDPIDFGAVFLARKAQAEGAAAGTA